ncbi:hypothetical protein GE21DRAFT_1291334 [Neurospora crassa]|nr:hypothetical protein GE21DRAFT_1291334 [Neurospora crassa]
MNSDGELEAARRLLSFRWKHTSGGWDGRPDFVVNSWLVAWSLRCYQSPYGRHYDTICSRDWGNIYRGVRKRVDT